LYAVSTNPEMVVASRLIMGISAGSTASVVGMISRGTTKEERTGIFSVIFSGRQLGLVFGPVFNYFLQDIPEFYIFSFPVTKYTSPGVRILIILIMPIILFIQYIPI